MWHSCVYTVCVTHSFKYEMTRLYVEWHIHSDLFKFLSVWHDSYVTWLIYMWHDKSKCVMTDLCDILVHTFVTQFIPTWNDSSIYDMPHSHLACFLHMQHASFRFCNSFIHNIHSYNLFIRETTHSYMPCPAQTWHASFVCDMPDSDFAYTYAHQYKQIYLNMCMYTYMMYIRICTSMHIYIYMYIYYIFTYIYTCDMTDLVSERTGLRDRSIRLDDTT